MKKIPFLPNVITGFGLSCGLFAIFKMTTLNKIEDLNLALMTTALLILMAALADLLDGAVARLMKAESAFGSFFDSIADAVSFGVAPSVIVLQTASLQTGPDLLFFSTIAAMIFSLCGVLRLVRFNVSSLKKESEKNAHSYFIGLPIPAGALLLVSSNLFLIKEHSLLHIAFKDHLFLVSSFQVFLGYLMVSRVKFPSIKTLHVKVASFQLVIFTAFFTTLLFYGAFHYFSLVFFSVSLIYLLFSLCYRFFQCAFPKAFTKKQSIKESDEA